MAADHTKEPKCCCVQCGKEFYTIYFEKHFKSCIHKSNALGTDKVVCPLCGKRLKEINTSHLRGHGLSHRDFVRLFPSHNTLSDTSRENKKTLKK